MRPLERPTVPPFARLRPILIFGLAAGLLSACAQPPAPKPVVAAPTPSCGDFSFPIYFETGSDDLTQAARAVLMDAAGQTKGCPVARIEVLGLADADGPAHRNLLLSRRRARRRR